MATMKQEPVQASRLIPRNIFADLGANNKDECAQLTDLRLPGNLSNGIRLQPVAFNEQTYKVESNVSFKDERGILNTKQCAVSNFMRWRNVSDKDSKAASSAQTAVSANERTKLEKQLGLVISSDAPKVESNTKVVEWSDGTKSLVIGDQIYEIQSEAVHRAQCFAQYSKFHLLKGQVNTKMIVKPSLRSQVIKRTDSHVATEDQVKLTLAVEAKQDLMYDISNDQRNQQAAKAQRAKRNSRLADDDSDGLGDADDFESEDDEAPAAGHKRTFKQLAQTMKQEDSDDEDSNKDYGARKRSRREQSPEQPAARSARSGRVLESDSEEGLQIGQTIKMPAQDDAAQK